MRLYSKKDKNSVREIFSFLVFNSTYFSFNNKIYKQGFQSPMDSSLQIIADIVVMQDLEEIAIQKLPVNLLFCYSTKIVK